VILHLACNGSGSYAACSSAMEGTWRNINPNTPGITRVDLTVAGCGDADFCDVETGICTTQPTTYTIGVYGKCHPTDCDWGARTTTDMGGSWHRAIYRQAWATDYVWVKAYDYHGRTRLRVRVHTDFTDADGRTDYTSDERMLN
jgi:hypothetical protein